ncbi:MAG TPA: Ig-like domain-containing protein, partial [Acidobacteriota bacterium]|nr:Ig-like domain-containing protein [Acidobacteriota bacterium]
MRFDHLKKHPLIFWFSISLIFLTCSIQFQPAPFTVSAQSGGIRIREINPVVNEQNQIPLTAIDASNQPVTNVVWESGSPEIASVDAQSGRVSGVRQGFATITARRG